jgi:hypothetical protein
MTRRQEVILSPSPLVILIVAKNLPVAQGDKINTLVKVPENLRKEG